MMHLSNLPKNVPGKFSAHFLGDLKNAFSEKKQPLECATSCVKSEVILIHIGVYSIDGGGSVVIGSVVVGSVVGSVDLVVVVVASGV